MLELAQEISSATLVNNWVNPVNSCSSVNYTIKHLSKSVGRICTIISSELYKDKTDLQQKLHFSLPKTK